jgi:hypothetical protein
MAAEETAPDDYREIYKTLTDAGLPYFVEGGQAVNIWATFYRQAAPKLEEYLPFTSKDCDLWVGAETFAKIDEVLDGNCVKGTSPADGQLGIFTTKDLPPKIVDLMIGVFGIPANQIGKAYERSLDLDGAKVLDPIFLLKGKCHNLVQLDQSKRQDEKHMRMMTLIVPAHLCYVLRQIDGERLSPRQYLKEVKIALALKGDRWVREALEIVETPIDALVPFADMAACGWEQIERFAESELKRTN